jgi:hypothetical protein
VDVEKSPRRERSGSHQTGHQSDRRRHSIVLPDVTGLTSAVESPAKGDLMRIAYGQGESAKQGEGSLLCFALISSIEPGIGDFHSAHSCDSHSCSI